MTFRRVFLSSLIAPILIATALAQAGLVIQPKGDQTVNPSTGVTTLPQGGSVLDNAHGIRIEAAYIEHKRDDFVKATNATIFTSGQTIKTPSLNYAIQADRVDIAGPLEVSSSDVTGLKADRAVAFLKAERVVALGNVRSNAPVLAANAVVFDTKKRTAFLYGNYRFESKDGKTKLSQAGAESALLVNFPKSGSASATTKIAADDRALYLKLIEQSR
jgi:lipopolysaccharide assembly outer membrane protein LptD (OstA)